MAYDAGLVERLRDALMRAGEHGARERGVFSGRGFLFGTRTFLIAYRDSLLVKVTPDEYPSLLALPGITPFAPGGERPMGTWLVVPAEAIADDPELLEWVERGARGVRAASVSSKASKGSESLRKILKGSESSRKILKGSESLTPRSESLTPRPESLTPRPESLTQRPESLTQRPESLTQRSASPKSDAPAKTPAKRTKPSKTSASKPATPSLPPKRAPSRKR